MEWKVSFEKSDIFMSIFRNLA